MRLPAIRATLFRAVLAVLPAAIPALAAEPGAAPDHKITQARSYLEIDPIYTTIVSDGRPAGLLMVDFGLDVPDDALRRQAVRALPVLRDAWLRSLMAFTAIHVHPDAQPDAGLVAARLQAVTDRALGRKGARILLTQVAMRLTR